MKLQINPQRISQDEAYMRMAEIWAMRSKANRLQVGVILVKDTCIIADGYNGMPRGAVDDICEYIDGDGNTRTKDEVMHAESNAFGKLSKYGGRGAEGATLYCTHAPCIHCAKLCIQAGISRFVFRNLYKDTIGLDFLMQYNIEVVHLGDKHESVETSHICHSC